LARLSKFILGSLSHLGGNRRKLALARRTARALRGLCELKEGKGPQQEASIKVKFDALDNANSKLSDFHQSVLAYQYPKLMLYNPRPELAQDLGPADFRLVLREAHFRLGSRKEFKGLL
jgi:hypothetical protein